MRGQLSAEYLFLTLVALALVSISIGALIKIREAGDYAYRAALFRSSAQDIYNIGEELCAMGKGNSMKVHIFEQVKISESGGQTVFASPELNISVSKNTRCVFGEINAAPGELVLKNVDGEIRAN